VSIGLNTTIVIVGSQTSLPLEGDDVTRITSHAMVIYDDAIDKIRQELIAYAEPICVESLTMDLPLPPLRAINHTIPLIDEKKVYHWHSS
jgi:hypothetical protein